MAEQRKCPFCEETIINDAKVCHYCGRQLSEPGNGEGERGFRGVWQTARTFVFIVVIALAIIALILALRSWLASPGPLPFLTQVATTMLAA